MLCLEPVAAVRGSWMEGQLQLLAVPIGGTGQRRRGVETGGGQEAEAEAMSGGAGAGAEAAAGKDVMEGAAAEIESGTGMMVGGQ